MCLNFSERATELGLVATASRYQVLQPYQYIATNVSRAYKPVSIDFQMKLDFGLENSNWISHHFYHRLYEQKTTTEDRNYSLQKSHIGISQNINHK